MRQQPYSPQVITQYLLGTLSPADTERFDELSITDQNFIDELNAAERDLIDSYVNGELDNQVQSQFEKHYLTFSSRRERVQLARSFYQSAPAAAANRAAATAKTQVIAHLIHSMPVNRRTLTWQLAFGVLVLVGLAIGGWVIFDRYRRTEANDQLAQSENKREEENRKIAVPGPTPPATTEPVPGELSRPATPEIISEERNKQSRSNVVSVVLAPQMRGGTVEPALTLTPRTESVAVRLELEPNDFSTYRVSLLTHSGEDVLWRSNRSLPRTNDGDKSLNVRFPATLLEPGSYVLRVWGLSQTGGGELISDYRFRVVK